MVNVTNLVLGGILGNAKGSLGQHIPEIIIQRAAAKLNTEVANVKAVIAILIIDVHANELLDTVGVGFALLGHACFDSQVATIILKGLGEIEHKLHLPLNGSTLSDNCHVTESGISCIGIEFVIVHDLERELDVTSIDSLERLIDKELEAVDLLAVELVQHRGRINHLGKVLDSSLIVVAHHYREL